MNLGTIFYINQYDEAFKFINENGLTINEIEPDENGRRFQIAEIPPPTEEDILNSLRAEREQECFPIINRGILWYNTLTEEQRIELDIWYKDWLNVTETKVIPEKPSWL